MKRRVRIALYSLVYLFVIAAFFGIANKLGWDIEPDPENMAYFVALYIGGLVPIWTGGGGPKSKRFEDIDWDKEMERRRKMGEDQKNKLEEDQSVRK